MSTYDLNMAQCLRDVTRLGYTEVHNVCSSAVTTVPWGIGPWMVAAILTLVVAIIALHIVVFELPIWVLHWQYRKRSHKGGARL